MPMRSVAAGRASSLATIAPPEADGHRLLLTLGTGTAAVRGARSSLAGSRRAQTSRGQEAAMRALVVYESHWGNTELIAEAIAEGIGPEAQALTTTAATPELVAGADLLVAGAPVMAFGLPRDSGLEAVARDKKAPRPGDVSHAPLRDWLETLPES